MTNRLDTRPQPFITADIVASMIGFEKASRFLAHRDRLERDHGFPAPMPTSLKPLKWRRDAVQSWVDTIGYDDHAPSGGVVSLQRERMIREARR